MCGPRCTGKDAGWIQCLAEAKGPVRHAISRLGHLAVTSHRNSFQAIVFLGSWLYPAHAQLYHIVVRPFIGVTFNTMTAASCRHAQILVLATRHMVDRMGDSRA